MGWGAAAELGRYATEPLMHLVLLASMIMAWPIASAAEPSAAPKYALITATRASTKHLEDESYVDEDSGHPITVHRYLVTLKNVRVLDGAVGLPTTLRVEMHADQPSSMGRDILILLKISLHLKPEVVKWQRVMRVGCFYPGELTPFGLGEELDVQFERYDKEECADLH